MSREIKIILAVFGGLFALAILAVVALVVSLPMLAKSVVHNGANDPTAARRVAAKIATFDIPRGYHIGATSDMGLTQIVTLLPNGPGHATFRMQLQGTLVPSGNESSVQGMKMGMNFVTRLAGSCDLKDDGTDEVDVRGVHVKLSVLDCPGGKFPFRIETGVFPGNAPQATITAMGFSGADFDTNALHALLRSVR
jgi:hypothetical protein